MRRRTLLTLGIALTSCGWQGTRGHPLQDGTYVVELEGAAFQDTCGLQLSGEILRGRIVGAGNYVRFEDAISGTVLVGSYKADLEEFILDGTVMNATRPGAGGASCELQSLAIQLLGEVTSSKSFAGTLSLRYHSEGADACLCELWSRFTARPL
jgi:hypothetical protein